MTIRHFTTLLVFAAAGVASAQPTRVPLRERERAVEALARALEREQTPGLTPLYFGSYVHRTPDQRGHSRDYDFGYSFVDGQGELVACEPLGGALEVLTDGGQSLTLVWRQLVRRLRFVDTPSGGRRVEVEPRVSTEELRLVSPRQGWTAGDEGALLRFESPRLAGGGISLGALVQRRGNQLVLELRPSSAWSRVQRRWLRNYIDANRGLRRGELEDVRALTPGCKDFLNRKATHLALAKAATPLLLTPVSVVVDQVGKLDPREVEVTSKHVTLRVGETLALRLPGVGWQRVGPRPSLERLRVAAQGKRGATFERMPRDFRHPGTSLQLRATGPGVRFFRFERQKVTRSATGARVVWKQDMAFRVDVLPAAAEPTSEARALPKPDRKGATQALGGPR